MRSVDTHGIAQGAGEAQTILTKGNNTMNKYIALYISSLDSEGKKINAAKRTATLERVEKAFIGYFEGFTETEAIGGWSGESGKVIKEKITIVKSFYEMQSNATVRAKVRKLAEGVKKDLNQECVSVEQNGDLELV